MRRLPSHAFYASSEQPTSTRSNAGVVLEVEALDAALEDGLVGRKLLEDLSLHVGYRAPCQYSHRGDRASRTSDGLLVLVLLEDGEGEGVLVVPSGVVEEAAGLLVGSSVVADRLEAWMSAWVNRIR